MQRAALGSNAPTHRVLCPLQSFVQVQQQQAQVRALIGQIAQNCFKLCVDGKPGTRLSSSEQSCMVRHSSSDRVAHANVTE